MQAKYPQHQAVQSPGQDSNPSSLVQPSAAVVVSNNREVRIESVSAYRDAGVYECTAHNTDSSVAIQGTPIAAPRMTLELEVECEYLVPIQGCINRYMLKYNLDTDKR